MIKPKHSLIFLTYNHPKLIDQRLNEVGQFLDSGHDLEVVAVDNGSSGIDTRLVLTTHAKKSKFPIRILNLDDNVGFSAGFNKGVFYSEGMKIYLLSDDVAIFGDFIAYLDDPDIDWERTVIGHRLIPAGAGWNDFAEQSFPYLDGYFFAMLRTVWDRLGGFDQRFSPHDYEDVDLSHRIKLERELEALAYPGLPIRHSAASTIGYSDERYERTVEMRRLFAEKWGLPNVPKRP
jgi:GT2 family glycosyltransferase